MVSHFVEQENLCKTSSLIKRIELVCLIFLYVNSTPNKTYVENLYADFLMEEDYGYDSSDAGFEDDDGDMEEGVEELIDDITNFKHVSCKVYIIYIKSNYNVSKIYDECFFMVLKVIRKESLLAAQVCN